MSLTLCIIRVILFVFEKDGPRKFLDSDLISNGALAKKPLKETLFLGRNYRKGGMIWLFSVIVIIIVASEMYFKCKPFILYFSVIPIALFGCVIIAGLLCFCCRHRWVTRGVDITGLVR